MLRSVESCLLGIHGNSPWPILLFTVWSVRLLIYPDLSMCWREKKKQQYPAHLQRPNAHDLVNVTSP